MLVRAELREFFDRIDVARDDDRVALTAWTQAEVLERLLAATGGDAFGRHELHHIVTASDAEALEAFGHFVCERSELPREAGTQSLDVGLTLAHRFDPITSVFERERDAVHDDRSEQHD